MGGDNKGNIGILMQERMYKTISTIPHIATVDPGVTTTVPEQAKKAQHSQLQYKKNEDYHLRSNHHNMDADLKTMVLDVVDNTYVFSMHNIFTVYMG